MLSAKIIATNGEVDFWEINGHVYRASTNAEKDIWGLPNGKRWECSISHWKIYRNVFSWVKDV
jgi:hypothetical protein